MELSKVFIPSDRSDLITGVAEEGCSDHLLDADFIMALIEEAR